MKILQLLPELNVGGVERGTVDLARVLIARGHEAHHNAQTCALASRQRTVTRKQRSVR